MHANKCVFFLPPLLITECNIEYTPPSQHVLTVLSMPTSGTPNKSLEADRAQQDAMSASAMNYEKLKVSQLNLKKYIVVLDVYQWMLMEN